MSESTPKIRKKIPLIRTGNWEKDFGGWDGFHKAAEISVGRKLEKVTVFFSKPTVPITPSQTR